MSVARAFNVTYFRAGSVLFGAMWTLPYAIVGSLRTPDLLVAPALLCSAVYIIRTRRVDGSAVALGGIAALTLIWIFVEVDLSAYLPSHDPARMILVRWSAAIPIAYCLCMVSRNSFLRWPLLTGATIGLACGLALIAYDYTSFQLTGTPGFSDVPADYAWAVNGYRASGIFGHPNSAAILGLLIVPFLLGLSEEQGRGALAVIPCTVATVACFIFTQSRGATLVCGGLLAYWIIRRWPWMFSLLSCLAILFVLLIYAVDPVRIGNWLETPFISALISRFETGTEENVGGRFATLTAALALIAKHPLGMGSTYGPILQSITGTYAAHNGLAHLTVMAGVLLGALVTVALLYLAGKLITAQWQTENWVAAYLLGISIFEDFLYGPIMAITVLWLVGTVGSSVVVHVRDWRGNISPGPDTVGKRAPEVPDDAGF